MSMESKESSLDEVDIVWKTESGSFMTRRDENVASGGRGDDDRIVCSASGGGVGVKISFCSAILCHENFYVRRRE